MVCRSVYVQTNNNEHNTNIFQNVCAIFVRMAIITDGTYTVSTRTQLSKLRVNDIYKGLIITQNSESLLTKR